MRHWKNQTKRDSLLFEAFISTENKQCLLVRQAIERFRRMQSDRDFLFDEDAAKRAINFPQLFTHFETAAFRGRPFELLPFQQFIVGNIFGWKWRDSGLRCFKTAYVEVPRKNGKTMLAAPVAGYALTADREGGAQVYCVATKEEQAKICWRNCVKLFKSNADVAKCLKFRVKSIEFDSLDAFMKPLGSDSHTLDGLNPHCVIADELHKWVDPHLWEVMQGGMGTRSQPLMFAITTAGNDQSEASICWQMRKHAANVLSGLVDDPTFFPFVCTIDDGDDPFDPVAQMKANPTLGIVKTWQFMKEKEAAAKVFASSMNDFLNQQLNVWTQSKSMWISPERWDALEQNPLPDLRGKRCYGGLDLAQVGDLVAFLLVFPKQEGLKKPFAKPFFFIPKRTAEELEDRLKLPIKQWHKQRHCFVWDDNIIRLTQVAEFIAGLKDAYDIRKIFYDRAGAREVETILKERGLDIEPSFQGFMLSKDINKIEELVLTDELRHDGNPFMRWQIMNCIIKENIKSEKMIVKPDRLSKIDGPVSLAMACGAMTVCEVVNPPKKRVFVTV